MLNICFGKDLFILGWIWRKEVYVPFWTVRKTIDFSISVLYRPKSAVFEVCGNHSGGTCLNIGGTPWSSRELLPWPPLAMADCGLLTIFVTYDYTNVYHLPVIERKENVALCHVHMRTGVVDKHRVCHVQAELNILSLPNLKMQGQGTGTQNSLIVSTKWLLHSNATWYYKRQNFS